MDLIEIGKRYQSLATMPFKWVCQSLLQKLSVADCAVCYCTFAAKLARLYLALKRVEKIKQVPHFISTLNYLLTMAYSSVSDDLHEECDPRREERDGTVLEIGDQAVWSLSSCKAGFGIDQLRDDNTDTYWQSDGQLPHLVNIQFHKKMTIQNIWIYADYKADESYTPSRISIRAGTGFSDLQEIELIDLNEPNGWVSVPLKDAQDKFIRTFMIQLAVLSNHQSGRDTHLRSVRVHSPVSQSMVAIKELEKMSFVSKDFNMYNTFK